MRAYTLLALPALLNLTQVIQVKRAVASPPVLLPSAASAFVGQRPGRQGIVVGERELFLSGGALFTQYWHALRHDPESGGYVDRLVGSVTPCESFCWETLKRGDVLGDARPELVGASLDGPITIRDERTGAVLGGFDSGVDRLGGFAVADVDHDGRAELLVIADPFSSQPGLSVFEADGTLLWSLPALEGMSLVVAELDGDDAVEIVTSAGDVVDADTHAIQHHFPVTGGLLLEVGQLDADRLPEIVIARSFGTLWAFDVDVPAEKWHFENFNTSALELADLDGDGIDEVLVGDAQFGGITFYDGVTLAQEGFLSNPDHGITDIAVADLDDDPGLEIAWGTGSSSTGTDAFFVSSAETQAVEWTAPVMWPPMVGPARGDVDGDGRDELVAVPTSGFFGFNDGMHVALYDAKDLRLRHFTPPILLQARALNDVTLYDRDGDGNDEVVVAGYGLDAQAWVFEVSANRTFTQVWTNATRPVGASFRCILVTDLDGNGAPEFLGGIGGESSANPGNAVYVYDLTSGVERGHTAFVGTTFQWISHIAVDDVDGDGHDELLALLQGGAVFVYDAATLAAEFSLPGPWTALATHQGRILLGTPTGEVRVTHWNGASLDVLRAFGASGGPIVGITPRGSSELLVGTAGKLSSFQGGLPKLAWTTGDYGARTGRTVLALPGQRRAVTCGDYGVLAFDE
ncbi:MAG: VCBS repeat-containing protein [Planctomycetes bacterium]|nr:VCBS repeat-containing protein [Planctomycetota bacterium]